MEEYNALLGEMVWRGSCRGMLIGN